MDCSIEDILYSLWVNVFPFVCGIAHPTDVERTDRVPVQSHTLAASTLHGGSVTRVPLNSKWFQSYSRALLEDDPNVANIYVNRALDIINETLKQPQLENSEREAILVTVRYLRLIEHQELKKAS